jgi:hypothetical protein
MEGQSVVDDIGHPWLVSPASVGHRGLTISLTSRERARDSAW